MWTHGSDGVFLSCRVEKETSAASSRSSSQSFRVTLGPPARREGPCSGGGFENVSVSGSRPRAEAAREGEALPEPHPAPKRPVRHLAQEQEG